MTKGEATKLMILEHAAPIFNRRGYAACSIQELMDATGLEKGGIYRHFASKEELAVAAFRYAMQQTVAARLVGLEGVKGAIPRLRHVVKAFVEIPSPVPGGCPLLNIAAYAESGCEGVQGQAKEFLGAWKARLLGILEDGIASGELRADVDAPKMANAVISMLEGSLVICRIEGTKDARRDAQETLGMMLGGLAA